MHPEGLRSFFRLGMVILFSSVLLLFFQRPDTPEFVVTALSILIGAALIGLVAWVARRQ